MKLLFCTECYDVFNLVLDKEKSCSCGKTRGKYIDNLNAVYYGCGVPMGFNNSEFIKSMVKQKRYGSGEDFKAFAISNDSPTFIKKD